MIRADTRIIDCTVHTDFQTTRFHNFRSISRARNRNRKSARCHLTGTRARQQQRAQLGGFFGDDERRRRRRQTTNHSTKHTHRAKRTEPRLKDDKKTGASQPRTHCLFDTCGRASQRQYQTTTIAFRSKRREVAGSSCEQHNSKQHLIICLLLLIPKSHQHFFGIQEAQHFDYSHCYKTGRKNVVVCSF